VPLRHGPLGGIAQRTNPGPPSLKKVRESVLGKSKGKKWGSDAETGEGASFSPGSSKIKKIRGAQDDRQPRKGGKVGRATGALASAWVESKQLRANFKRRQEMLGRTESKKKKEGGKKRGEKDHFFGSCLNKRTGGTEDTPKGEREKYPDRGKTLPPKLCPAKKKGETIRERRYLHLIRSGGEIPRKEVKPKEAK